MLEESELTMGNDFLSNSDPLVAIFGGDKVPQNSKEYQLAYSVAKALSDSCFNIVSGGGFGIMEAANAGALSGSGLSYVLNFEDLKPNPYFSPGCLFSFKDFSVRKQVLFHNAVAYLFFPGGVGTLNELFESLALISIDHLCSRPMILIGSDFWIPLMSWIKNTLIHKGYVQENLFQNIVILDDIDEIIHHIKHFFDKIEEP